VSYYGEAWLGSPYRFVGQPERYIALCRAQLARTGDTNIFAKVNLLGALPAQGLTDEAMVIANGIIDAAEAIRNPCVLTYGLLMCSYAFRDTDPARALEAARRAVLIARDSGNRLFETQLEWQLSTLELQQGDLLAALNDLAAAIRNNHESGNVALLLYPLAALATFLDRHGRAEAAAAIAGFALNPMTTEVFPDLSRAITHLREVLSDETYESLARKGKSMTIVEVVTYAYDQIDQARTELKASSK
jgi:tetratricopeptide (TPR) repeat protein